MRFSRSSREATLAGLSVITESRSGYMPSYMSVKLGRAMLQHIDWRGVPRTDRTRAVTRIACDDTRPATIRCMCKLPRQASSEHIFLAFLLRDVGSGRVTIVHEQRKSKSILATYWCATRHQHHPLIVCQITIILPCIGSQHIACIVGADFPSDFRSTSGTS
jgi:hypothetical protein